MSAPELLEALAGSWKGISTLVLPTLPPPGSISDSIATIAPVAGGAFARIEYTWAYEGQAHEGMLLVGREKNGVATEVVWIDSWHQSERFMLCDGQLAASSAIDVVGHYPASSGPDWGWRMIVRPTGDGWELVMHNISPDGEETLAFRNVYTAA